MTTWTGTASTISSGQTAGVSTALATYRDAIKAMSEAWTSYGSAASFTGATSNPVLNNGTWLGKYKQVNKAVEFYVKVTMGSTTTYGSGNLRVALPVTPSSNDPGFWTVATADASTGAIYMGTVFSWTGTTASLAVTLPAGGIQQVSSTVPWTYATSDTIVVRGSYEAA